MRLSRICSIEDSGINTVSCKPMKVKCFPSVHDIRRHDSSTWWLPRVAEQILFCSVLSFLTSNTVKCIHRVGWIGIFWQEIWGTRDCKNSQTAALRLGSACFSAAYYYYDTHYRFKKLVANLGLKCCLLQDFGQSRGAHCLLWLGYYHSPPMLDRWARTICAWQPSIGLP